VREGVIPERSQQSSCPIFALNIQPVVQIFNLTDREFGIQADLRSQNFDGPIF